MEGFEDILLDPVTHVKEYIKRTETLRKHTNFICDFNGALQGCADDDGGEMAEQGNYAQWSKGDSWFSAVRVFITGDDERGKPGHCIGRRGLDYDFHF